MLTPLTPAEQRAVLVREVDRLRELGVPTQQAAFATAHRFGIDSFKALYTYRREAARRNARALVAA